jgi:signal transduction histidine kinase
MPNRFSDNAATPPLRILHLEDSDLDHALAHRALQRAGTPVEIERVETLDGFIAAMRQKPYDAVLADYRLPGFTAVDAWDALSTAGISLPPFVLLSGAIGEDAAVYAIRRGISDYLHKDDVAKLPHVLTRAIEVHASRLARARADQELAASEHRLAQLTEHLQTSIEEERASIAREIHDDIGGALTAVRFDLAWIARHAAAPEMQAHAQAAAEMLRHAVGASQRIMRNLRPPILEQGLVAAIEWLAEGFERRTAIPVQLRTPVKPVELAAETELVAYRVAQESLTNITKHAAGCTAVTVDLSDGSGMLTLEIADNGCGLEPAAREKSNAFGLRGLQERARKVGGWIDISAPQGSGTSITLSVPTAGYSEGDDLS